MLHQGQENIQREEDIPREVSQDIIYPGPCPGGMAKPIIGNISVSHFANILLLASARWENNTGLGPDLCWVLRLPAGETAENIVGFKEICRNGRWLMSSWQEHIYLVINIPVDIINM